MLTFGPVPSRRLGRSLGIDNIPPKACSYACTYCQVGPTTTHTIERRRFYGAERVLEEVEDHLARAGGPDAVDALTFVPDGEPTLDVDLGREIEGARRLGVHIAVITNGSLLASRDVRSVLLRANPVSIKVDALEDRVWHRVNRPPRGLRLDGVLEGVRAFAAAYEGRLWTETMLVEDFNESEEDLRATAEFLEQLNPAVANLSIPTRPPAEKRVRPPGELVLSLAFGIVSERLPRVEVLSGYEGDAFACSGDARRDILSITAVHPMRESAVRKTLAGAGVDWEVVAELLESGQLVEVEYKGHRYYLRPIVT